MARDPLKGKLIRADVAYRCCREAVRIATATVAARFYQTLGEIWSPPDPDSNYFVGGFVSMPKGPAIEFGQGWAKPEAAPKGGTAIAVGSIVLAILASSEASSGIQTATEMAFGGFEAARKVGTDKGTDHCRKCMENSTLSQAHGRAWQTRRIRARI